MRTQRTWRRELGWQREIMVFLSLLRMQLILGGDAIDAKCLPVERCCFFSQMMRRWGMTSVARLDWALFSAVDRIPFVKCWFFVRIRRNINRAASLMLRCGPCDCFKNCVLPLLLRFFRLDEISLFDCQIAARHFTEAKYLRESGSKDQRNVGDLAARAMNS